jgi:hypothetical protein
MKLLLTILTLLMTTLHAGAQDYLYAVAKEPTPVLNSPDFQGVFGGGDGMSVKTDNQGLIREMEFIALPGTVFDLIGEYDHGSYKVYKVQTNEYQYGMELFVDSRFVELRSERPKERLITLPTKEEIYKSLDSFVGNRYCWGGNYNAGIKKLIEYYQPGGEVPNDVKDEWTLTGCDCSGLMYGEGVEIAGLSAEEIAANLKPLDMIVWNGHVIYVYDANTSIQSGLSKGGVVKLDLIETLREVMESRKPVNDYGSGKSKRFVVRRWFSTN